MPATPLQLPALDPAAVPEMRGTTYPEPFRQRVLDRTKRKLGDACGLTQFGVNLVNRSGKPAQYLEIGTRNDNDQAHYPDDDLKWVDRETMHPDGTRKKTLVAAHKDGKPY